MTQRRNRPCPDCDRAPDLTPGGVGRREFLKAAGIAAATAAGGIPLFATPKAAAAPTRNSPAETAVTALYETLTPEQKTAVCFSWDYQDTKNKRGLLRTH
ncbi:MAG TPA: twin-arginine translocation signal domain-containing protein, partial [Gemmataceae bacterium]|nr:twin-arginine translocation signal domain-containing protein [Gemmataceae bacterium]